MYTFASRVCFISKQMLMKVQPYLLDRLTRWEFFQFIYDVLALTNKLEGEMPLAFTAKTQELRTAFDIYDVELMEDRRPPSKLLMQADKDRDFTIRKMYQLIRAYSTYRFEPEKERAATSLLKTFKRYGTGSKIARYDQETQSAVITNLMKELSRDEAKQHFVTLDLTIAMTALRAYNDTFLKEQRTYFKLQGQYVNEVVKNARLDVRKHFLEFIDITNALSLVEGEEKYEQMKKIVRVLWHEYSSKMKQRTKKPTLPKPE